MLAAILEQGTASALGQIQHTLEIGALAGVRIRHLLVATVRCVFKKQLQPCAPRRRRDALAVDQVLPVHREDQIKALEIGALDLARAQLTHVQATPACRCNGARIGSVADVIAARPSRIDFQTGQRLGAGELAQYGLGSR